MSGILKAYCLVSAKVTWQDTVVASYLPHESEDPSFTVWKTSLVFHPTLIALDAEKLALVSCLVFFSVIKLPFLQYP